MKPVSSFVLAAALLVGSAVVLAPVTEASAQKKKKEKEPAGVTDTTGRTLVLSKEARPALKALETVIKAKDQAGYAAALAAATAVSTTPDEKYVLAKFRLEHGLNMNDPAEQTAALEAVLASGAALPAETPQLHQSLGIIAFNAGNWQRSHDAFAQAVQLEPGNVDAVVNLALTKIKLKKDAEALPLLRQAIAANKAAGKPVPEAWYRNALQIGYAARSSDSLAMAREVMTAYPTAENWRNVLVVYRDAVRSDDDANLDTLRLMRASKALTKTEYYSLATAANRAGLPGEAKAVLDEAVAANVGKTTDESYRYVMSSVATKVGEDRAALAGLESRAPSAATGRLAYRTADAYFGYGDYAKAAALYRVALSKGGADVDRNLVNMHLGMALAMSGDKAGAEAAFKAVTGARAQLAGLWIDWLSRPAA